MLDTMTLKNMTTGKMLETIAQLEKEVKFRESVGEEIEENKKKMKFDVSLHQEYMKDAPKCAAAFEKWKSSFVGPADLPKKEIKTRNFLEKSDNPFE